MFDLRHARFDGEAPDTYGMMVEDKRDFLAIMYVIFAGFSILVWDHMITFGDEVKLIWRQKKTFIVYIFLLNRYIVPLSFVVCFYAYLSPTFTYTDHPSIVYLNGSILLAWVAVTAVAISQGYPAPHTPAVHACTELVRDILP
ncbi:hypothetical protein CONPUDRAFT_151712 [Coniophora puteana RWD-64-598 SS2]|uniref:DUF6533 domain-containing protein n=1 Tax=Coniophora puteana (strain RWD-64-598) TaxID=741705 RepID=A0A5M3MUG8_CONPW|nr:uncharacterized protein CONPUDRAFT_151712 [Coniophora puteana RWD-64-598 SS2]EIW82647.1 hypothetical protein CONPUDRAFT_151712 [Coniophora puteana RWD-64-598 SS2]